LEVVRAAGELQTQVGRISFALETQRIRLFRELRLVYPIAFETNEQRYKIRGLEIPTDPFSGGVVEDELCASLGYLCHLLFMMGKYLSVQFRYRLYFQASRSAIQDDRAIIWPLFFDRSVERDQFEHGVRLLGRNIQYLCEVRNIRVSSKLHPLAKVKRIYENVIDGY
jgi:hypothetical protein